MRYFEERFFNRLKRFHFTPIYSDKLITLDTMLEICNFINEHQNGHFEFSVNKYYRKRIRELHFPIRVKFSCAKSLFRNCSLNYVNFENIDITECDNVEYMLSHCNFRHNPVIKLDTRNVNIMDYMFNLSGSGCAKILFDTQHVLAMRGMFRSAGYEELDIRSFDMLNVNYTESMFKDSCIKKLVAKFNMQDLVQFDKMFSNAYGILKVDLSLCDLHVTTTMRSAFKRCSKILFMILHSSVEREIISNHVFKFCTSLRFIIMINFELKNERNSRGVTTDSIFKGCLSLVHVSYRVQNENLRDCRSLIV